MYEIWRSKAKLADTIIFDLDGTLVNSDFANFMSYKAAVMHAIGYQVKMNFDPASRMTREVLSEVIPNISNEKMGKILEYKNRIYSQYLSETKLNIRLIDIIDQSKEKELILATNSRQSRAKILLEYHKLTGKFVHKIYRNAKYPGGKYMQLASLFSMKGRSILIFENDEKSIQSAIACGASVDGIINVDGGFDD